MSTWKELTAYQVSDYTWYPASDHFYESYRSDAGYGRKRLFFLSEEAAKDYVAKKPAAVGKHSWGDPKICSAGRVLDAPLQVLQQLETGKLSELPKEYVGTLED